MHVEIIPKLVQKLAFWPWVILCISDLVKLRIVHLPSKQSFDHTHKHAHTTQHSTALDKGNLLHLLSLHKTLPLHNVIWTRRRIPLTVCVEDICRAAKDRWEPFSFQCPKRWPSSWQRSYWPENFHFFDSCCWLLIRPWLPDLKGFPGKAAGQL